MNEMHFGLKFSRTIIGYGLLIAAYASLVANSSVHAADFPDQRPYVFVLPAQYAMAIRFGEGLAAYFDDNKSNPEFGFIDIRGNLVIQPQYSSVGMFSEGVAPVRVGGQDSGRWGFINKQGRFVIDPQYTWAQEFSEGHAFVGLPCPPEIKLSMCSMRWIRHDGTLEPANYSPTRETHGPQLEITSSSDPAISHGKLTSGPVTYGFVYRANANDTGQIVLPRFTKVGFVGRDPEWPIPVAVGPYGSEQWVFVNPVGDFVIQPNFSYAWQFADGLAEVKIGQGDSARAGFINKYGHFEINPVFKDAGPFYEGLAAAQSAASNKWGYIGRDGLFVVQPQFDEAGAIQNGMATVSLNGKWGLIALKVPR
jgi:WG containing repeat